MQGLLEVDEKIRSQRGPTEIHISAGDRIINSNNKTLLLLVMDYG
jgi:hypothetical protein